MKVRKKPVEVEAVQLTWQTWNEVCEFVGDKAVREGFVGGLLQPDGSYEWGEPARPHDGSKIAAKIPTLEGDLIANENDWIIRGVKGELYPCKPDIFEATYEPLESEGWPEPAPLPEDYWETAQ
jgi:hypothetical protein